MLVTLDNFKPTNPQGFIVLDGVNGAGKTTFQKKICSYLSEHTLPNIASREPGATKLGQAIRELVVEAKLGKLSQLSEAFLFCADRAQHVHETIKPALANNNWVVVDRYYYSTLAFQGYGRGLDLPSLKAMNALAIAGLQPDLVLLFDLPAEVGLARTSKRQSSETDCFELEEVQFHKRLRNGFIELASTLSEPFVIVDASQAIDKVWQQIKPFIDLLISNKK